MISFFRVCIVVFAAFAVGVCSHAAAANKALPAETTREIDLSSCFEGIHGTAVFFQPHEHSYAVYQKALSEKESSPCSTFKIFSTYAGLDSGLIDVHHSVRPWNGTIYWNESWNRDIGLPEAFHLSCVWYYRQVIDDIGPAAMQSYLDTFQYGNRDMSDWKGDLNTNEPLYDLKGFWIESSLKISPKEQVQVLHRLMTTGADGEKADVIAALKKLMFVADDDDMGITVYGKTGYGVVDGKPADAWFVGMYDKNGETTYFAVRLQDPENPRADSKAAKEIALRSIKTYIQMTDMAKGRESIKI